VSRPASFVSSSVELHLVTAGNPVPVSARLAYEPSDPFAVGVSLRTEGGPTVQWVMSRDLLAAGLHAPSGDGDVGVWPSTNRGADVVCVSLSSPDGQALLFGKHADIAEFLARTFAEVPAGTESDFIDIDALVEHLLRG
jgi:hypothetical protein